VSAWTCVLSRDYRTGFGLVNRFIDQSQVVNTNKYKSIADFQATNHSALFYQSIFSSLYLVTALNNGSSSAVSAVDVSL
jgi:hypothetical protein